MFGLPKNKNMDEMILDYEYIKFLKTLIPDSFMKNVLKAYQTGTHGK